MKVNEIKKTIEQVVRTEYVAEDGTVFYNEDECKKYEDSALFAVSNKLKKVCEDTRQWELLGFGSDEEYIEIFDIFWSYEWDHAWTYGNGSLEGYFGYVESQYSKIIMPTETDKEEVK